MAEAQYYREIADSFCRLLSSDLRISLPNVALFPGIGNLNSGVGKILRDNQIEIVGDRRYLSELPPLLVDIFVLVLNPSNDKSGLIILEVKDRTAVGLMELSQLIGYLLVSGAPYGFLVNISTENLRITGLSAQFAQLLAIYEDLTLIKRIRGDSEIIHKLGCLIWDSPTKDFLLTNLGALTSIPDLAKEIVPRLI